MVFQSTCMQKDQVVSAAAARDPENRVRREAVAVVNLLCIEAWKRGLGLLRIVRCFGKVCLVKFQRCDGFFCLGCWR